MEIDRLETKFHHIAISVDDMDRALEFYCDLLSFEVDWDMEHRCGEALAKVVGMPGADARIVMLKGYGLRLELLKYHSPKGEKCGVKRQCDFGLTHFAISVKNLHQMYDDLAGKGGLFNCPPQNLRPGVWATYMRDPEGVTIELVEYT